MRAHHECVLLIFPRSSSFLRRLGKWLPVGDLSVCVCFATLVCAYWHTPFSIVHEPHNTDSVIVILREKFSIAPFVVINQIRTYIIRQPFLDGYPPLRLLSLVCGAKRIGGISCH